MMIVDRMLPKLDGLSIIRALRTAGNRTPVLILSSLGRVEERIKGLRLAPMITWQSPSNSGSCWPGLKALARRGNTPQAEQTCLAAGNWN